MNNAQIAAVFEQIADLLEIQDANPFRVRAYRNAARTVHELSEPLARTVAEHPADLPKIKGIGKDLAEKIITLVETSSLPMLDELYTATPPEVLTLLRVPKLGPKKAGVLFKELGITNLEMLKAACEAQQIRSLKGFGVKTETEILKGIDLAMQAGQRIFWEFADHVVEEIREYLLTGPKLEKLEAAGSYRRGKETVGDLDFLVVAAEPNAVMDHLGAFPTVAEVIGRGDTKMSVRLQGGLQVDLRVVPEESFGAALQYFTGSQQHNIVLRGMAKDRGWKINEYGVFEGEKRLAGRTEEEVYGLLGLPAFPPELREARGEFELAKLGPLPKLIETADLIGDLHMHTTATDGTATLEEMVAAAQAAGLKYIAITDHSKRVTMANGLDGPRLLAQWKEIDKLNGKLKNFRVLKGVEVDILEKGGLDLEDEILAGADWVVASVHYGQNQPSEQITQRILDAIQNPNVSAIAHPTGRLINSRASYAVDLSVVMQAAVDYGKLLELNASPARLDLDDVHCAAAKRLGIPIVISSDAHSTAGLGVLRYGVLQARRAGLTKADVANTLPWEQLQKRIGKK